MSYVYSLAMAVGQDGDEGWRLHVKWIGWLWNGQANDVLSEWRACGARFEVPTEHALPDNDPRRPIQRGITYLENNIDRVDYERVVALHQQGISARAIARQCGMNRSTVRSYLESTKCPERAHRCYSSSVTPFASYLRERWHDGQTNASRLWAEIVQRGFQGAYSAVRRFVHRFRTDMPSHSRPKSNGPRLSSHQVSWLFFRPYFKLSDVEISWKSQLLWSAPQNLSQMV